MSRAICAPELRGAQANRTTSHSRRVILASVLLGLLSTNVTFTIFNVALVGVARELHSSTSVLTWAITGPLLVVGMAAPAMGKLGDVKGHRRVFLVGLVGSAVCALLTMVAWNAGSLIVARLFSGIDGACLGASSWSLLFSVYPPAQRTRVLGWWSLVGAGGPVLGVAAGGPVVAAFGFRPIFAAQAVLIGAALAVNFKVLPETPARRGDKVDLGGAVLLSLAVVGGLLALSQLPQGPTSLAVALPALACVICLAGFAVVEKRAESPVFPLAWLARGSFVLPSLATSALNFAYMGGFFLTPLFLEQGLGYGVAATGLFQIARPLCFALMAPFAGALAARVGERMVAVLGLGVMVGSMASFSLLSPGAPAALVALALAASGLANGLASPCLSSLVAASAEAGRLGQASGGLQVASQVGVVAGIQGMETIEVLAHRRATVVGSYHQAYLAGAAVAAAALVALVAGRRSLPARARHLITGIELNPLLT